MRISDWSSDVCSSDLTNVVVARPVHTVRPIHRGSNARGNIKRFFVLIVDQLMNGFAEVAFVQRARPKTQAGAPPSGIVENVPCNGFAFPAGVGRDYDFSGLFNQPGYDVVL